MDLADSLILAQANDAAGAEDTDGESPAGALAPAALRYPVELIDVIVLQDGQRVTIRPILPQDEVLTQVFFRDLSMGSRHNRFMRAFRELPATLLKQFTDVDYKTHLALIAEIFVDGEEIAIGEARYALRPDGTSAEFAVSIADDWQGRGLGALLLCRLIERAGKAGVRTVAGETLASNAAMLHLAAKAGFSYEFDREIGGLVHLSRSIDQDFGKQLCTCG